MTILSLSFLFLFLPLIVVGYYLIRPELKNVFLVFASLLFYTLGDPHYIGLLLLNIGLNYLLGVAIERSIRGANANRGPMKGAKAASWILLVLGLLIDFGLLFFYKYLRFAVQSVNTLFSLRFEIPIIGLPLGISFYTFRSISYLLDIFWGMCSAQKNPIQVALYISFFPQISMGPITEYRDFVGQFQNRKIDFLAFSDGVKLIIVGLFKKLVFANGLGFMVDKVFAMQDMNRPVLLAWMGIIGYLIQLYYDFSGYSDIAIGIGDLFGFRTPKNFDYPYLSKSIHEFWSRWHITLGAWLRDYIYTPIFRALQGKRKLSMMCCNLLALFVTWLFSGFWHGAAWHFVAFGLVQFFFIAMERLVEDHNKKRRKQLGIRKQPKTKLYVLLSHLYFLLALIFSEVLFRVEGLSRFLPYLQSMFGLVNNSFSGTVTAFYWGQSATLLLVGGLFCFPVAQKVKEVCVQRNGLKTVYDILCPVGYMIMAIVAVSFAFTTTYQAFIYFQF